MYGHAKINHSKNSKYFGLKIDTYKTLMSVPSCGKGVGEKNGEK